MALVKGWPRTGNAPLCTKNPALPPGWMCFHSNSTMKFSYSRSVRSTPVETPVETMMPSRTENVPGAQLTLVQPVKSRPLKSGFQSAENTGKARKRRKTTRCISPFWTTRRQLNRFFSAQKAFQCDKQLFYGLTMLVFAGTSHQSEPRSICGAVGNTCVCPVIDNLTFGLGQS